LKTGFHYFGILQNQTWDTKIFNLVLFQLIQMTNHKKIQMEKANFKVNIIFDMCQSD